jgi:hypothetical protein
VATIYATVADVEKELKAVLPTGFPPAPVAGDSTPSAADAAAQLLEITTGLRVRVINALGQEPIAGNDAVTLVKRGVVNKMAAWALRRIALGRSVVDVEVLVKPYEDAYKSVLEEIKLLPDLFKREIVVTHHVGRTSAANRREPLLDDDVLGRTNTY